MKLSTGSALLIVSVTLSACSKTGTTPIDSTEPTELQSEPAIAANETQTNKPPASDENSVTEQAPTDSAPEEDVATSEQPNAAEQNTADTSNTSDNQPDEPKGLKGVVYTDTEIELFWERSTDTNVFSYTVSRDAEVLTTIDALSYYDNTVKPGTTYQYTLQSVNSDGIHSTPISLFLTTPVKAPTINDTNALTILQQVASATNGRMFSKELRHINTTISHGQAKTFIENGFVEESNEYDGRIIRNLRCDQQGELTFISTTSSLPGYSGEFKNCVSALFDGESVNGKYSLHRELSKYVYNPGIYNDLEIDPLKTTDDKGKHRTLEGSFSSFGGAIKSWQFNEYNEVIFDSEGAPIPTEDGKWETQLKPFKYTAQAFEGETRLVVKNITRKRGALINTDDTDFSDQWKHELFAEFTLQSPTTGNKLISVTTAENFQTTTIGTCFESGQLKITAQDGSEMLLDASNGDAKSATLRVTADGVISVLTIDWASDLLLLHSTADDVFGHSSHPIESLPNPEDCSAG